MFMRGWYKTSLNFDVLFFTFCISPSFFQFAAQSWNFYDWPIKNPNYWLRYTPLWPALIAVIQFFFKWLADSYPSNLILQYGSGADLSLLLVDTLNKSCTPVTDETMGKRVYSFPQLPLFGVTFLFNVCLIVITC